MGRNIDAIASLTHPLPSPGNVPELQNVLERPVILMNDRTLHDGGH